MPANITPVFDCGPLHALLSTYAVGLTLPDGVGHFKFVGSGTLIDLGVSQGILTANHVLDEVPRRGLCKVALFRNRDDGDFVSFKLEDSRRFGLKGADVAYLELPHEVISTLRSIKTFKHLKSDKIDEPTGPLLCFLFGAPDEFTSRESLSDGIRKRFYLLGTICDVLGPFERDGYEVLSIKPKLGQGFAEPSSYGGVSGGGVWLIFLDKDGKVDADRRLMAVAFREIVHKHKPTIIECCGPSTLYNLFLPELHKRFSPISRDDQST